MRVANGHPWIFANEVNEAPEGVNPGDIVDVYTHDKKFIGKAALHIAGIGKVVLQIFKLGFGYHFFERGSSRLGR